MAKVEERLQEAYQGQGPRPRESEAELDKAMKDLEYKRTTQSMSLMEEKKLLRQIGLYKKEKMRIKEYSLVEDGLKDLKVLKSQLYEERKAKEGAMVELSKALRKMQLAQRVGVAAEELVEETLEVPEESMSRVVGRGGTNLRRIEETCRVSLDFNHGRGGSGKVSGTAAACAMAKEQIQEIVAAVSEEIAVPPTLASTLLAGRAVKTQALMREHQVRIEIQREKNLVKVQGLPARLKGLRAALAALEAQTVRREMPVDGKLIGPVVGKGGVHLKQLGEEFPGVGIDVDREKGVFVVVGLEEEVGVVVESLERLVSSLEDKEERLTIDKFTAHVLMDQQGKILKAMRKTGGCNLFIDVKKDAESGALAVRAPLALLEGATTEARRALAELETHILTMNVDPSMVRFIIGKKGAVINALRLQTQALIEAEDRSGLLRIYHPEEAGRLAAKAAILDVVLKNQAMEVTVPREAALSLKGSKGAELREKFGSGAGGLDVQMDIDGDTGVVGLRGAPEALTAARTLLEAFAEENHGREMDLPPEDYWTLISGGDDSLKKQVQDATGVSLYTIKEDNLLKIRGPRVAVAQAEGMLRQALEGGEAEGTTVHVPLHPDAYPGLVGKGGAGINKFREEHGVALIILRMRNQIRVRGSEPAQVARAAAALRTLLDNLRAITVVPASVAAKEGLEVRRRALGPFKARYDVQVEGTPEGYKLRGLVAETAAARDRLVELLSQRARAVIPVSASQALALATAGDGNWRKVREDFAVACDLDVDQSAVILTGATPAVERARAFVYQTLEILFGGMFGSVPVPVPAMPALAAPSAIDAIRTRTGLEHVVVDREGAIVRGQGTPEAVQALPDAVDSFLQDWEQSHARVHFESWMLPYLLGKGGAKVKELQKRTGVNVEFDREAAVVRLSPGVAGANKKGKERKQAKSEKKEESEANLAEKAGALVAAAVEEGETKEGHAAVEKTETVEEEDEEQVMSEVSDDVKARSIASVQAAKAWLMEQIETIKKEHAHVLVTVPQEVLPYLIGKKGANLVKIKEESKAALDIMDNDGGRDGGREGGNRHMDGRGKGPGRSLPAEVSQAPAPKGMVYVQVKGTEAAMAKAQELIAAFVAEWRASNLEKEVKVLPDQIRIVVGAKGSTIRGIAEDSGAKLDVDRENLVVIARGTSEAVDKAVALLEALIAEDLAANPGRRMPAGERGATNGATSVPSSQSSGPSTADPVAGNGVVGDDTSGHKPVEGKQATGDWNFPFIPPGADASYSKLLMDKQAAAIAAVAAEKKKKKKKKKSAKRDDGDEAEGDEKVLNAGGQPMSINGGTVKKTEDSGSSKSGKLIPAEGEEEPVHFKNAIPNKGTGKEKKLTEDATAANVARETRANMAQVAEVVTTEKAGRLLDLIMGGSRATISGECVPGGDGQGEPGGGMHTGHGEGAPTSTAGSKTVFKSSATMLRL